MKKMEPFSIWLKFYTKTNLSAGNPLEIVPMADFQGKSPRGAKNPKMEPLSIRLKFHTKTILSAGNPLKIVPMASPSPIGQPFRI